ncbi:HD domain-containing protein [Granulosicoccus sp. 3-233]|uniref:HD domain-containing protein n=1 Tax=Granulosicoccus sp. 3-233 TaxID=3417969 RepID=UPI003D32D046
MTARHELLHRAIRIATTAHDGQNRKYVEVPYIAHPLSVMMRVRAVSNNEDMLAAAILHDVLEDGPDPVRAEQEILQQCGQTVTSLVRELTDQYTRENYPSLNRAERKAAERLTWKHKSAEAKTIKLADLIDNTEHICETDNDFFRIYLQEKRELLSALQSGDERLYRQAESILQVNPRPMDSFPTYTE